LVKSFFALLRGTKYILLSIFVPIVIGITGINAFGQKASGIILDKATRQPIINAVIQAENLTTRTNNLGQFEIDIPHPGDSLKITAIGYKIIRVSADKPGAFLTIHLEPKVTQLNEVTIHGTRDFKQDSLENRDAFAKQFNYKAPTVMDAFTGNSNRQPGELISINPLILIAALTKKSSPEYILQQKLLSDEHEQYIDERFNKGIVLHVTNLKGDTLSEFLTRYRPTFAFTQKATVYDMEIYIKDCFVKFEKEGFPVSKPLYEAVDKKNRVKLN
jgi:CarboxypepD_reg-like domain